MQPHALIPLLILFVAQTNPQQPPPQAPAVTERVVVTATAAPAEERALGRSVTILTRDDIERFAAGVIADVLRLAPGVDVRARGERGVQADFVLRAASFGQTLVLVDGMRLNDAQSGHHNADFPVSAADVDRVEVAAGAASSAHGADAFGGTVNIVTRAGPYREATAAAGSFSSARGEAAFGAQATAVTAALWGSRSDGFMFDRDHALGGIRVAAVPWTGARVSASHLRKVFGANGFYGPSPSKEWTDLTMAAVSVGRTVGPWAVDARAAYRNHGDRFRWDIARPGFAENVHRTNAIDATVRVDRSFASTGRLSIGGSGGGDWIASSNLGDHTQARGSAFAELQLPIGARVIVQPAVRLDGYSTFGSAASPSLAVSAWTNAGLRFRASAGRAFRAPTYTERYYTDPNHRASAELEPERGWTLDGGADWRRGGSSLSATAFRRWDSNVIDWVRASARERWQTTNVHHVDTQGIELAASREFEGGFVRATGSWIDSRAPALTLLSKYVLDYTRQAFGAQMGFMLPTDAGLFARIDYRRRSDGQRYTLIDARVSKRVRRVTLFVDGSNLLDETYTEIAGVAMPGRSAMAGATVR
jgi:iron complex outermembrane receptor protein